jgi:hypothetical protein
MQKESEDRVRSLRAQIVEERAAVTTMEAQFKHSYFKKELERIAFDLGEMESFFLSSLDREQRTPSQETYWLNHAEFVFYQMIVQKRKHIQGILARYGPDAIAIPYSHG